MRFAVPVLLASLLACAPASTESTGRAVSAVISAPADPGLGPLPHPIPVLLFHRLCDGTCAPDNIYGMSQTEFYRTLLMLKSAGLETISSGDFARYMKGDRAGLPVAPVLVTFDDSRLADGYAPADGILAATGSRATMFVITGRAEDADPDYMSWSDIGAAYASGRWDIELHAHRGHTKVDGRPWLAYKLPGETYEEWKARFEADVWAGLTLLHQRLPGYAQHLIAVPFGDYGQKQPNDPAIPAYYTWFLSQRVTVWFTQPSGNNPEFARAGLPTKERGRYTVTNTTTAEKIFAWLKSRTDKP